MPKVVMMVGFPASGKGYHVTHHTVSRGRGNDIAAFPTEGVEPRVLNRDMRGGTMAGLLLDFQKALAAPLGLIWLDNTYCTVEDRAPFIAATKAAGFKIVCRWMATSAEDAQVNALHRMWDRYETVFMDAAAIKAHPRASKDPNMFPAAAIFSYKKRFEKPTVEEGFSHVEKIEFVRNPPSEFATNKAVILDYDGTLRRDALEVGGEYHYPVRPDQVEILPRRKEVLESWKKRGYLLLGASTQSGVAKGHLSMADAHACFKRTNDLLGQDIGYEFCPHGSFPVSCYCRKPQAGIGILLTRKHNLNPSECVFVGDLGTDRTFAQRCGFQFQTADEFFAS